jgi:hypothetical protein
MAYIGKTPTIGNFQVCDAITVVDAQAAYTMQVGGVDVSPETANHMLVSLNGILQAPTTSFTVAGSTITFASALETGDVIDFIQILGNVLDLGVPSDNTVTTAKLADSSVSLAKLTATGTKDATTFLRGDNTFASAQGAYESQLLHVRDEKSANTAGGTFTSGDWRTRTLNTVMTNEISGASLSSDQVTLPSGTYFINASAPFHNSGRVKAILRNTSDSSDAIIGTSDFGSAADDQQGTNFITGRFTIASSKTFEIQQRCESTTATTGFGVSSNSTVTEVYTDVQIWKVS